MLWDYSASREDVKIGKFKQDVKYKQNLHKSVKLTGCDACKDDDDAEVMLKIRWGSAAQDKKNKNKPSKGSNGLPWWLWPLAVVLILLVCAGAAGAYFMMNQQPPSASKSEPHDNKQRLTNSAPVPPQECEMRLPPQACHNYQPYSQPLPWNPTQSQPMYPST